MTETADPKDATWAEIIDIARTVGVALLIALVLRIILFQPFTIPSASMEPGLLEGDYVVVTKFDYGWSRHSIPFSPPLFHGRLFGADPKRGDVVVFKLPRDGKTDYIKRIIGLPGDRVQVRHSVVYVNGKAIPRVLVGDVPDVAAGGMTVTAFNETRPDGKTYTTFDRSPDQEGDNTDVYVVPAGQYFAMGDNRDNSSDSRWPRATGVGFVPAENLEGKARFILASWTPGASLFKPWTWFTHFQPGRFLHGLR